MLRYTRTEQHLLAACVVMLGAACALERNRSDTSAPAATRVELAQSTMPREPNPASSAASCDSSRFVHCFRDTAYGHPIDTEPGYLVDAHWIVFGAARDSFEFSASVQGHPSNVVGITVDAGSVRGFQERDSLGNTARYSRLRLRNDGVVAVSVSISEAVGDTVEYGFRVTRHPPETASALRATGRQATLTISSNRLADRFSVVPVSVARSADDLSRWSVFPRTYQVALVPDTLYEICRIPCLMPDTVKLTPDGRASRRY